MIRTIVLMLVTVCVCPPMLFAQEMTGKWISPATQQRPTEAIVLTAAGSAYGSPLLSREARVPEAVQRPAVQRNGPPFPVLTPKSIVYPQKAVQRGWEGQAVVAVEVLPDGSVGRTALAKSSGHKVLDNAAQEAIRSWKFASEAAQQEIVSQYVDIPVSFKLRSEHGS